MNPNDFKKGPGVVSMKGCILDGEFRCCFECEYTECVIRYSEYCEEDKDE